MCATGSATRCVSRCTAGSRMLAAQVTATHLLLLVDELPLRVLLAQVHCAPCDAGFNQMLPPRSGKRQRSGRVCVNRSGAPASLLNIAGVSIEACGRSCACEPSACPVSVGGSCRRALSGLSCHSESPASIGQRGLAPRLLASTGLGLALQPRLRDSPSAEPPRTEPPRTGLIEEDRHPGAWT